MNKPADKSSWGTPKWLFDSLNEYYQFKLDAAASSTNTLCEKFFTIENNAMKQDWSQHSSVFCNPPYSAKSKKTNSYGLLAWCEKAHKESQKGCAVVLLIPADTSTHYFRYCYNNSNGIYLLIPRIKFSGVSGSPKFGSMIVEFKQVNKEDWISKLDLITISPGKQFKWNP